jgi:hypothetical protein
MQPSTQFSIFLTNKPGVLAQVCQELARSKVNILALSMMDTMEHGVLRMVVDEPEMARDVLTRINVPMAQTDVLMISMPNRPGAMADICGRLAEDHVSISYCYATTGAVGGKTLGVFKVSDVSKAIRVLSGRKPRREGGAVRPNAARRGRR